MPHTAIPEPSRSLLTKRGMLADGGTILMPASSSLELGLAAVSLPGIRCFPVRKSSRPFGAELHDRLSPPQDLLGQDILRLIFCSHSRHVSLELLQGGEDKFGGGDEHATGNADCRRFDGAALLPRNFPLQNFVGTGLRHPDRCVRPIASKSFPRRSCALFGGGLRRETMLPPGGIAGERRADLIDGRVQFLWTIGARFFVSNLSTHHADKSKLPPWWRKAVLAARIRLAVQDCIP
jgi:hypothetical protein